MLRVTDLSVMVEDKAVLLGVNWAIGRGEVHLIMGANGSGKSSLAMILLGNKEYRISNIDIAKVEFEGKNLLAMSVDERARAGLYVAWQSPLTIPGVSVFTLCKSAYEAHGKKIERLTEFKAQLEALALRVGLTKEHVARGVNEGFSGGERKRLEMMQLLLLQPKLAILDELDSGIDQRGVGILADLIEEMRVQGTSMVVITHNNRLLEKIRVDQVWEMKGGVLSNVHKA